MRSTKINGYPNYILYEDGRIYSIPRKGVVGGFLKVVFDPNDKNCYPRYTLRHNGKKINGKVHKLLAEHFIPNPYNKPCVLHRDDNRQNWSLDNLYWGDWSENNRDRFKNGGYHSYNVSL